MVAAHHDPLVIVGGGLAGTMTLVQTLLKIAADDKITQPVDILMLEREPKQCYGGIAYGKVSTFKEFNLNLSSKRTKPFPDSGMPDFMPTFEEYIMALAHAQEDPGERAKYESYLQNPPRQLYGSYLETLVEIALEHAGSKVNYDVRYTEAVDLDVEDGKRRLQTKEGEWIDASHLVLSTGFKQPGRMPFLEKMQDSKNPRYLDYPYYEEANAFYDKAMASPGENALVVGTGLSAMDAALRLLESGYTGKITMMSRRALTHEMYSEVASEEYLKEKMGGEPRPQSELPFTKEPPLFLKATTEASLVRALYAEFNALRSDKVHNYTTEEIIGYWETFMPQLAKNFDAEEGRAMLGRLADEFETVITVLRVGTTPENGRIIREAIESGRLVIQAGHLHDIEEENGKLAVTYTPKRGDPEDQNPVTQNFDYVINGIGNSVDYNLAPEKIQDLLWRKIREKNLLQPHYTGDGVSVTHDFTLLDGAGKPVEGVSVIGVPTCGHVAMTDYPYAEKEGHGGRLPPFYLNIAGIASTVPILAEKLNELIREWQKPAPRLPEQHATGMIAEMLERVFEASVPSKI